MKNVIYFLILLFSINVLSQNDSINNLDEVRIEGIRANKNMPIPQIIINKAQLQKFAQGYEATQIIDDTPSITSTTDGGHYFGYTYFRIRGIDQTRINMTLNGVPLNEPEDQGGYFSNTPNFLENIQSLQIQRGIGTSTNGVSSYGGSINFVGNVGYEKKVEVKLTDGSFNTKLINFSLGSGLINDKFTFFINSSSYKSDGYRYGSGGEGRSNHFSSSFNGDKDILRLTILNSLSRNGMAWLPVSELDIKNDPKTNYNINDSWDNFEQTLFQLEYNRLFKDSKLTTTLFYTHLDGEYDYYMVGKNYFFIKSNFIGVNTNYNKKINNTDVNLGVNGNIYNRNHKSTFVDDLFNNKGFKNEVNSYVKVTHKINDFILFTDIQYRYAQFEYKGSVDMQPQKWSFLNPKFGLRYKMDNLSLYTMVGQSHREPTRSNLFGGSSNLIELSNIKSEKVIDYETGFDFIDDNILINFNIYYMNFENEITTNGEYGSNSLLTYYNLSNSYRSGVEINFNYRFDNNFEIKYNNNLSQNGISGTNLTQLYSPRNLQNISIEYKYKNLTTSLSSRYQSSSFIDIDNNYSIPEFIIFNANIGYKYDIYSLYLSMINLTNQEYFTNGNFDGQKNLFTNAPLNYNLTFKISL